MTTTDVTSLSDITESIGETTTEYFAFEDINITTAIPGNGSSGSINGDTVSLGRHNSVFLVFHILELVMTSLELMIWIAAAIKSPRWRKNYRNQMLMQISLARFVKRLIFTFKYLISPEQESPDQKSLSEGSLVRTVLDSAQIYIDFVIVILVFFFVKHMYDSLIIVLVKVRQNSLYKISICSWLLPAPISAMWTVIIISKILNKWLVYLLICCLFRWPLIFLGTSVYIAVLYRVLSDKIRKFARSLTIVTFLMCLVVNFYLVSKDIIELWCLQSFKTRLISSVSGLVMNFLILSLYIILITFDLRHKNNQTHHRALQIIPDFSVNETYKL